MSHPDTHPTQAPRVHALDVIRLFAMLLMIQGHTLDALVDPAQIPWNEPHWKLWVHMRGLTAPLFLMISGAVSAFGLRYEDNGQLREGTLKRRFKTGLTVMLIGYWMVFPANRLDDLAWVTQEGWSYFWRVNILQLNGITLILLTGLLRMTRSLKHYALWSTSLGLTILILSPFAYATPWFRFLPEPMAAYFSFERNSLFPVFPFSGYMFLGVGLGSLLVHYKDKGARVLQIATGGAALLAFIAMQTLPYLNLSWLPPHDTYKAGYAYLCLRLTLTASIICSITVLCGWLPRAATYLAKLGQYSLYAYVAHLAILYGTPWTPGVATRQLQSFSIQQGLLWIPILISMMMMGLLLWFRLQKASEKALSYMRVSAACALAFVLVF